MVYLLHFSEPFKHARHYIGFTESGLEQRMERHRSGDGAKILRALKLNGITFEVVKTWEEGDRDFERKLKNQKNSKRHCPHCLKKKEDDKS